MLNSRELDRLTEGWPAEEADLGLQMFAARVRADRPELSGPAMDRIAARVSVELDRQSETRPMRLTPRVDVRKRFFQIAPFAAAACLLAGFGLWAINGLSGTRPTTPQEPAKLIKQPPAPKSHIPKEGPELPIP